MYCTHVLWGGGLGGSAFHISIGTRTYTVVVVDVNVVAARDSGTLA
jgi:hypothetical protein